MCSEAVSLQELSGKKKMWGRSTQTKKLEKLEWSKVIDISTSEFHLGWGLLLIKSLEYQFYTTQTTFHSF